MIQYKQNLLTITRLKRQYHNIKDHTSEELYQDIFMLQKAGTEVIKMCQARHFSRETEAGCQGQTVFIN